ncbi:uncharacterized protein LOC108950282 [Ciona intestinalis]
MDWNLVNTHPTQSKLIYFRRHRVQFLRYNAYTGPYTVGETSWQLCDYDQEPCCCQHTGHNAQTATSCKSIPCQQIKTSKVRDLTYNEGDHRYNILVPPLGNLTVRVFLVIHGEIHEVYEVGESDLQQRDKGAMLMFRTEKSITTSLISHMNESVGSCGICSAPVATVAGGCNIVNLTDAPSCTVTTTIQPSPTDIPTTATNQPTTTDIPTTATNLTSTPSPPPVWIIVGPILALWFQLL